MHTVTAETAQSPDQASQRNPIKAFKDLVTEHPGIQFEEWDTATLDEPLRDRLLAHYQVDEDGTRTIVVPLGQDPIVRLAAVRTLLNHQGVTA